MPLFSALRQTRLGKWLHRRQDDTEFGQMLRSTILTLRSAGHRLIGLWPPYLLYDLRERARLRRFERQAAAAAAEQDASKGT